MATITVTTASDVVASDGLRSLREAVTLANATPGADTIVFAPALEGRTLTLTQGELVLRQDVVIDGDSNNDGKEVVLSGGDHGRIFHALGKGTDVSLKDLVVTHGRTTGDDGFGGALRADCDTSLRLDHVAVTDSNTGDPNAGGGGIYSAGSLTLTRSTVNGNSTAIGGLPQYGSYRGDGGGILSKGPLTLIDSTISGNAGGIGGGISGGAVTLTNSAVSGNYALHEGGGISGETVFLTNSTINGNAANYGHGGGISGSVVMLTNSSVSENRTGEGGVGGIYADTVTLSDSTLSDNLGGGIYADTVTLLNSTLSDNLNGRGGIYGN